MIDNITVRRAVREDCPRLMELIRELAVYEKAPDEVTVSPEHFEQSGFGPSPVWWAFVAETGNGIEGMALYYIRYSTWKGQRMYLEDIVVTHAARGRSIGTMLFDRLIEEAREKGFNGMVWQALDWNKPALDFYSRYNARLDPEWVNCSLDF